MARQPVHRHLRWNYHGMWLTRRGVPTSMSAMSSAATQLFDHLPAGEQLAGCRLMPRWLYDRVLAFYHDRDADLFDPMTLGAAGLEAHWWGCVCLNCLPSPETRRWIAKACVEYDRGRVREMILVLKAATDARWFKRLAARASSICFIRGRLSFEGAARDAPFPSMILYCGRRARFFDGVFGDMGVVLARKRPGWFNLFWKKALGRLWG